MDSRATRVPVALQAVFLASNRGKEVNKPPPNQVANKVYKRTWFGLRRSSSINSNDSPKRKPRAFFLSSRSSIKTEDESVDLSISSEEAPVSLQEHFEQFLEARGYSTETYRTLETAYYNKPTPLQQASYHTLLLQATPDHLRQLLACGISPNPCNRFGESLIHRLCRRGDVAALRVLLEGGASVQVSDDIGRTPLHDACSAGQLPVIELLLEYDSRMLCLLDSRGATPFNYIREEDWDKIKAFWERAASRFWRRRIPRMDGPQKPPPLALLAPNSRPLADPESALQPELASKLCCGALRPSEVLSQMYMEEHEDDDDDDDETYDSDSDDDDDDSFASGEDSDSEDSFFEEFEDTMKAVLEGRQTPWSKTLAYQRFI